MAKEKITLQMLGERMAQTSGRSKSACEHFVRSFFSTLKEALQNDNIVKIKGFGTFKLVVVNARESVNINTGKRVNLPEYNKITFTPDKAMKDKVNRPFSQFTSVALDDDELMVVEETQKEVRPANKITKSEEKQPERISTPKDVISEAKQADKDTSVASDSDISQQSAGSDNPQDTVVSDNPQQTVVSDTPQTTNAGDKPIRKKRRSFAWILWILLILIFSAGAYSVGYMRLISTPILDSYSFKHKVELRSSSGGRKSNNPNVIKIKGKYKSKASPQTANNETKNHKANPVEPATEQQ